MGKLVFIALAVLAVGLAVWISSTPSQMPYYSPEAWWGPMELKGKQDLSVRPFQVKFSEEMIKDLKYRLKNHRPFTPPLEGIGFQYGFNNNHLDTWLNYWADKYPFARQEKMFNQFPQFKTNIQGLDIHFVRVKPQVPANVQVVPLLLLHGWPGSVREFFEAIPLLTRQTKGYDFAFEVIVPSLPGYGFSDGAVRPGLGAAEISVVLRNMMKRLGFKKFYVQGGDWGSVVASYMVTLFPEEILGHHTNMAYVANNKKAMLKTIIGAFIPSLVVEPHLADRMYPISSVLSFLIEESGYYHLQATKPDTIGVAIADSPAGLLAYVLEKFTSMTNINYRKLPDGGLETGAKFTKDQLIDNLMMYWASNSFTTAVRIYAESANKKAMIENNLYEFESPVPTWAFQAKYEIFYHPPSILRIKYPNLINTTVHDDGGHFLAFELPQIFAEDVFRAVKAFREWHTKNKTEL